MKFTSKFFMESQWISSAINILHLTSEDIIDLPKNKAEKIRETVQATFLDTPAPKWWWEHLLGDVWSQQNKDSWKQLPNFCPKEKVWFIPLEEHGSKVYESGPNIVSKILGECPAFEYALVGQNLDWILIENHHNYLIGSGHLITEKLTLEFGY